MVIYNEIKSTETVLKVILPIYNGGIVVKFLYNYIKEQSVRNLVEELDCFIDNRRTKAFRQFHKTEEYQKMAAEIEKFRVQLSSLDVELLEQYETVVLQEQNYISAHEYLQGVLDGIALRNVFYSLNMNESSK
jgi:Mlc titration factor MtfA (ptsG expression regulator)